MANKNALTIREIVAKEKAAGRKCGKNTVQRWIYDGRFPHAYQIDPGGSGVWLVPEADYVNFQRPRRGRPSGGK